VRVRQLGSISDVGQGAQALPGMLFQHKDIEVFRPTDDSREHFQRVSASHEKRDSSRVQAIDCRAIKRRSGRFVRAAVAASDGRFSTRLGPRTWLILVHSDQTVSTDSILLNTIATLNTTADTFKTDRVISIWDMFAPRETNAHGQQRLQRNRKNPGRRPARAAYAVELSPAASTAELPSDLHVAVNSTRWGAQGHSRAPERAPVQAAVRSSHPGSSVQRSRCTEWWRLAR
jgi:hypothetical protein